jgi:hypothetical protein
MDGSAWRYDRLHPKSESLTRFSPKHDDDRCASASRIHQLLALLSYRGTKNPARAQILALIAWDLRSICSTYSNRGFTSPLLVNRVLVFPSLVLRGRHAVSKETLMSLDKIVVIALAVAFFGGVILLAIKSRQDKNKEGQPPASPDQNSEDVALQIDRREKERRKSKN